MTDVAVMTGAAGRDFAFLELAHRCANDLALAIGILNRGRASVADHAAQAALDDAAACIEAIALVHRALEPDADEGGTVELARYLPSLTNRLRAAYLARHQVGCRLDVDPGRVSPEVARTLGLIVCELTRNAAKHAFPSGRRGTVTVSLRARGAPWHLIVSDDGVGHAGVRSEPTASRGLAIVRALATTLNGGSLKIESGPRGLRATITFQIAADSASRTASATRHEPSDV